jgi:hypothetical protein
VSRVLKAAIYTKEKEKRQNYRPDKVHMFFKHKHLLKVGHLGRRRHTHMHAHTYAHTGNDSNTGYSTTNWTQLPCPKNHQGWGVQLLLSPSLNLNTYY